MRLELQSVLLIVLAVLLWLIFRSIKYGPRFLSATPDDWLLLQCHKIDSEGMWEREAPVRIQFVPITGWIYHHGFKYGKLTPITPPSYRVVNRLTDAKEYQTVSCWIRGGEVYDIDSNWGLREQDIWHELFDYASACKLEVQGKIPSSCLQHLSEILEHQNSLREMEAKNIEAGE